VRSKGFTLVEVMVAMLIVGVALPALLFQVIAMVDGTGELRNKAVAQWVAENQLATIKLQKHINGSVPRGKLTGETRMAGTTWEWSLEVSATEVEKLKRLEIEAGLPQKNPALVLRAFINE